MKLPALIRSAVAPFARRASSHTPNAVAVITHEVAADDVFDYGSFTHAQRLIHSRILSGLNKDGHTLSGEETQVMENALRLKRASIEDYALFLYNYMMQGGRPTHAYDYEYARAEILLAEQDTVLPATLGAASLDVLARPGVTVARAAGFDHGHVFHQEGHTHARWIPVYLDLVPLVQELARRNQRQNRLDDTLTAMMTSHGPAALNLPSP